MGGELFYFPYDGNDIGSFNKHKTEKHNHPVSNNNNFSGSPNQLIGTTIINLNTGATTNSFTGNNFIGFFGDNETAGAWIAIAKYICY